MKISASAKKKLKEHEQYCKLEAWLETLTEKYETPEPLKQLESLCHVLHLNFSFIVNVWKATGDDFFVAFYTHIYGKKMSCFIQLPNYDIPVLQRCETLGLYHFKPAHWRAFIGSEEGILHSFPEESMLSGDEVNKDYLRKTVFREIMHAGCMSESLIRSGKNQDVAKFFYENRFEAITAEHRLLYYLLHYFCPMKNGYLYRYVGRNYSYCYEEISDSDFHSRISAVKLLWKESEKKVCSYFFSTKCISDMLKNCRPLLYERKFDPTFPNPNLLLTKTGFCSTFLGNFMDYYPVLASTCLPSELTSWSEYYNWVLTKHCKSFQLKPNGKTNNPAFLLAKVYPFLMHIYHTLCSSNLASFFGFLKWMAYFIMKPEVKLFVVPIMIGDKGTGKGMIAQLLSLFYHPDHYYFAPSCSHLFDNIGNIDLSQYLLVLGDEVNGCLSLMLDRLKAFLTSKTFPFRKLYHDPESKETFCKIIITSNHEEDILTEDQERRFLFLHSTYRHITQFDKVYGSGAYIKFLTNFLLYGTAFCVWEPQIHQADYDFPKNPYYSTFKNGFLLPPHLMYEIPGWHYFMSFLQNFIVPDWNFDVATLNSYKVGGFQKKMNTSWASTFWEEFLNNQCSIFQFDSVDILPYETTDLSTEEGFNLLATEQFKYWKKLVRQIEKALCGWMAKPALSILEIAKGQCYNSFTKDDIWFNFKDLTFSNFFQFKDRLADKWSDKVPNIPLRIGSTNLHMDEVLDLFKDLIFLPRDEYKWKFFLRPLIAPMHLDKAIRIVLGDSIPPRHIKSVLKNVKNVVTESLTETTASVWMQKQGRTSFSCTVAGKLDSLSIVRVYHLHSFWDLKVELCRNLRVAYNYFDIPTSSDPTIRNGISIPPCSVDWWQEFGSSTFFSSHFFRTCTYLTNVDLFNCLYQIVDEKMHPPENLDCQFDTVWPKKSSSVDFCWDIDEEGFICFSKYDSSIPYPVFSDIPSPKISKKSIQKNIDEFEEKSKPF